MGTSGNHICSIRLNISQTFFGAASFAKTVTNDVTMDNFKHSALKEIQDGGKCIDPVADWRMYTAVR